MSLNLIAGGRGHCPCYPSGVVALPRVLAIAPDLTDPSGGVRKIYRHVDVLRTRGISAFIVHQQPGFHCTWFEHSTPVVYRDDVWPPGSDDILVVPELLGWQMTALAPGVPKVMFNQNAYTTFIGRTSGNRSDFSSPYLHPDFLATLVVSEDNRHYLEFAFPGCHPIFRIHNSIDPSLFHPREAKKRQIAYMPRRNKSAAAQVLSILHFRRALRDYEIVGIDKVSEVVAAGILRQSMIFLSFATAEGFGLPAAEAMACGCLTIGFHGGGGAEFLREPYAQPIEAGNVIHFVEAVEQTITGIDANPTNAIARSTAASDFIRNTYTPQQEEQDIVTAWEQILELRAVWKEHKS